MPHTPGPWSVYFDEKMSSPGVESEKLSIVVFGTEEELLGVRGNDLDECMANASLIAAAPELLAFVKYLVDEAESDRPAPDEKELMARAKSLIEKAEGGK